MRHLILILAYIITNAATANTPAKRALLIGISSYPVYSTQGMSWSTIHGANDVELIKPVMLKQGFSVHTITNSNAKAADIRNALDMLARQTNNGDIVYIHFSGHGQPYEDMSGDENDGWDEAIVPYDARAIYKKGVYEGERHIIDDELSIRIRRIREHAGKDGFVYVVLDACHIGGASRGKEDDEEDVPMRGSSIGFSPNNRQYAPHIDTRPVIAIHDSNTRLSPTCYLEACRAYQTNCEIRMSGHYYGALSWYVCQVLRYTRLSKDIKWINDVEQLMRKDKRLIRQNIVIEKSIK